MKRIADLGATAAKVKWIQQAAERCDQSGKKGVQAFLNRQTTDFRWARRTCGADTRSSLTQFSMRCLVFEAFRTSIVFGMGLVLIV